MVGYLTSRTLIEDGGVWHRRGEPGEDIRAETELGIELGRDLGAGATGTEAEAAIAGICVALEMVDVARPAGELGAVMDGNVFHRAVVFGPTRTLRREDLGVASLRLDETIHAAGEPMPEPSWAVRTVADTLGEFGETLVVGDRVLSGSFVHERLDGARQAIAAVEGLGRVSLSVAEQTPAAA